MTSFSGLSGGCTPCQHPACTAVARHIHVGIARSFPDPPPHDDFGLPMAIWA
ncbi:MAG: hypothetical protein AB7F51_04195 [Pseudorhodoplanes sp.]